MKIPIQLFCISAHRKKQTDANIKRIMEDQKLTEACLIYCTELQVNGKLKKKELKELKCITYFADVINNLVKLCDVC